MRAGARRSAGGVAPRGAALIAAAAALSLEPAPAQRAPIQRAQERASDFDNASASLILALRRDGSVTRARDAAIGETGVALETPSGRRFAERLETFDAILFGGAWREASDPNRSPPASERSLLLLADAQRLAGEFDADASTAGVIVWNSPTLGALRLESGRVRGIFFAPPAAMHGDHRAEVGAALRIGARVGRSGDALLLGNGDLVKGSVISIGARVRLAAPALGERPLEVDLGAVDALLLGDSPHARVGPMALLRDGSALLIDSARTMRNGRIRLFTADFGEVAVPSADLVGIFRAGAAQVEPLLAPGATPPEATLGGVGDVRLEPRPSAAWGPAGSLGAGGALVRSPSMFNWRPERSGVVVLGVSLASGAERFGEAHVTLWDAATPRARVSLDRGTPRAALAARVRAGERLRLSVTPGDAGDAGAIVRIVQPLLTLTRGEEGSDEE